MSLILAKPAQASNLLELVRQTQAGDDESARLLYERCRKPLLFVICPLMSQRLRRLYDSDDFLCETFADLCRRQFNENVLESPHSFWRYLRVIAENKVKDGYRKARMCERRGILQELQLDDPAVIAELIAHDISPDDALAMKEFVENWWEGFIKKEPPVYRLVMRAWEHGLKPANIAERIGLSVKDVYRIIRRVRQRLEESLK